MIIIGIDPGTIRMGYAVIKTHSSLKTEVLKLGILNLKNIQEQAEKLKIIYEEIQSLIRHFNPDAMAIEAPFYGKNVQSMLKLGRAQGIAMAAAFVHQVSVTEYAPKQIKLSITGNGNASKEQIFKMLQNLLSFPFQDKYLDATDALATALCHYFHLKNYTSNTVIPSKKNYTSPKNSWKNFIEKNPHRKI